MKRYSTKPTSVPGISARKIWPWELWAGIDVSEPPFTRYSTVVGLYQV